MRRKFKYDMTIEVDLDDDQGVLADEIVHDVREEIRRRGVEVLGIEAWGTNPDTFH